MLSFNDQELASITELASPLPRETHGDFLQLIASRIAEYTPQARGLGLLHRIAVEAQRDFLKKPPAPSLDRCRRSTRRAVKGQLI